ncbi:MAG: hypothetical protein LUG16_01650 [Candidatus Gastranaerophilales bacterium]|nr:hypothetical protein [Candidatus Gastranaerophilales bacterium]
MYIIEKIIKICMKFKKKSVETVPLSNGEIVENEDIVTCRHTFMPVDSTGEVLACTKCGYLVTKKRLQKGKNFFKYQ